MTSSHLPFELSEQSVADWLLTLSKLNNINSANELNKTIQKIRKTKHDSEKVLQILIQLIPTILFITNNIEISFLSEGEDNNKITRKVEKLSIQLLRNLSLAFCTLSEKKSLTIEEKTLAIYIALQLIGLTQRITTIFHNFPSSTLWKKTAELYSLAQKMGIYELEIKSKIKAFKNLSNIESVTKRNLLFSMLATYQFTSSQIQTIFNICEQQNQLITLNQQNPTGGGFVWNLENGYPPSPHINNDVNNGNTVNINATEFLSYLESKQFSSQQISGTILTQLINEISGFRKIINSSIPLHFTISQLIEGHDHITEYLKTVEKLNKIQQFSSQLPDTTATNVMSLEPMEFEQNHLSPKEKLAPPLNTIEPPKNSQTVKVLQTKYKQYVIAISNIANYFVGNLVLLCNSDTKPELGIIRQILFIKTSNSRQILIEKIDGKPSSHNILSPSSINKKIIMVYNTHSNPDIFITPSKLPNGTSIELPNDQVLTLNKLIDFSSSFMHYKT